MLAIYSGYNMPTLDNEPTDLHDIARRLAYLEQEQQKTSIYRSIREVDDKEQKALLLELKEKIESIEGALNTQRGFVAGVVFIISSLVSIVIFFFEKITSH